MMLAQIVAAASRSPDALALVTSDGQPITFDRLVETIRKFATRLRAEGLQPGQTLAVAVDNNAIRFCLWMAANHLGAVPILTGRINQARQEGVPVDMSIALQDQKGRYPDALMFGQDWFDARPDETDPQPDAGMIVSSSGTTGLPKFMKVPPGTVLARNKVMNDAAGEPQGAVLTCLNPASAGGLRYIVRPMALGHAAVLPDATPQASLIRAAEFGATEIAAPPPILADLVDAVESGVAPRRDFARLEVTGASISEDLLRRAEAAFGCPVTFMYGASEFATVAAGQPLAADYESGLVGPLTPGASIRIDPLADDPETGQASVYVPPELRVEPYLNAEGPFDDDGWCATSDLIRIRADGQLVHCGRADDLINTGGTAYRPDSFEFTALTQPGVRQAAAFAIPSTWGYDHVGLALNVQPGTNIEELRTLLCQAFTSVQRFEILVLDQLPHTTAGKIDRAELRRIAQNRGTGGEAT